MDCLMAFSLTFILISLKTHRKEMNTHLNTSNYLLLCSVGGTRYTRLALLSLVNTCALSLEVKPYPGWSVLRPNFDNILTFSADVWKKATDRSRITDVWIWFNWLVYVFCVVTVFAFSGWGEDVRRGYLSIWAKF